MGWADGSPETSARRESSCGDGRCCGEIRSEARARCTVRCSPSRPRSVCRDHFVVREHVSAGRYVVVASRPVRPAESSRRVSCRGGPPNPRPAARTRHTSRCVPPRLCRCFRCRCVVRGPSSAGRWAVVASRPVRSAESLRRTFCRGGPPKPRSAARTRHTSRCVPPRLCRCVWCRCVVRGPSSAERCVAPRHCRPIRSARRLGRGRDGVSCWSLLW